MAPVLSQRPNTKMLYRPVMARALSTRCSFVRSMDYKLDGQAAILVISPLISIIKDQISEMKSLGYSAVAASDLSLSEMRHCNFKVMFATAEKVKEKGSRQILFDHNSPLHQKNFQQLSLTKRIQWRRGQAKSEDAKFYF